MHIPKLRKLLSRPPDWPSSKGPWAQCSGAGRGAPSSNPFNEDRVVLGSLVGPPVFSLGRRGYTHQAVVTFCELL